ncbi:MAG: hypothetical protein ABIO21_19225 [Pseudomonas sp.]
MSDNKGKDGEHGALALLALAALKDNRLEVMRYSETNVPDMGQDIFLTASNDWVQQTGKLAVPNYQPPENFSAMPGSLVRRVRIDVKTSEVIDKTLAQKTGADIKKHPNTDTHILFGGRLTSAGQIALDQVRRDYPSKEVLHIDDDGIKTLASEVGMPIETLFPHLKDETKDK